jgi:hypothetical protein
MAVWRWLAVFILAALLAACSVLGGDDEEETESTPTFPEFESPISEGGPLVVAWVENGSLFSWRSSAPLERPIAQGDVIQPYVSPDGAWIAYTRGPEGAARTLWLADVNGTAERVLIDEPTLATGGEARRLNQVLWSQDSQRLYFNTLLGEGIDTRPADDLWQVDVTSNSVELLLADGLGGMAFPAPDGQRLAVVSAGTYGESPAAVVFYSLDDGTRQIALEFPAPATASEWRWYAEPRWLADGSGLYVAIPPVDLVYGEGDTLTALWWVPVEGDAGQIGTVEADFFGLPTFSPDGLWVTYLQRRPTLGTTDLTLLVAQYDGSDPTPYAAGEMGRLTPPSWLPTGDRFVYVSGAPGEMWLGQPGAAPVRFPTENTPVSQIAWAGSGAYVFSSAVENTFILNLGLLEVASPLNTITVTESFPLFDAALP